MKQKQIAWLMVVVITLAALPYLAALLTQRPTDYFGGFLFNPVDGNSYLAKMYQGWSGSWTFSLPYSAEPGQGRVLFLYYLALGHAARLTSLPLVVMFHLARLAGWAILIYAMSRFYQATLPDDETRWRSLLLAGVGSGLGWITIPFGGFPADLWVAEAYPFLASYANPHFPLALALMIEILTRSRQEAGWKNWLRLGLYSLALATLQPFGVVVAVLVLIGEAAYTFARERTLHPSAIAAVLAGGGPMLAYQAWLTRVDSQLAAWNAQNLTPSPPLWDLLLSFSPALLLAGAAVLLGARRKAMPDARLWIWAAGGLLLAYAPFSLQRRFLLGLFIPLAGLAPLGARWLTESWSRPRFQVWAAGLALSLPTTVLILVTGLFGVAARDPQVYITRGEKQALDWIAAETAPDSRILAGPELALYIPAVTGRRIFYGHPFETPEAEQERAWVLSIYRNLDEPDVAERLAQRDVGYVIWGPRERALQDSFPAAKPDLPLVIQFDDVWIFKAD